MRGIYLVEVIQMKEIRAINRSIGGIYTKGDYERLVSQNELLKDKVISFDFWDYLPLISLVVSAFAFVLSVVVWLFKVL